MEKYYSTADEPYNKVDQSHSSEEGLESPRLVLRKFLPHRLSVLSNTVSRAISGAYADRFGLSIPEWRVLAILNHRPGLSSRAMAQQTAMDNVTVSRAVSNLARRGLITKQPSSSDARRMVLQIADEGREIYRQVTPLALKYEEVLLQDLDAAERVALDRILTKLQEKADQLGAIPY